MALQSASGDSAPAVHYHIHWFPMDRLDWERFDTAQDAEEVARCLVQPGEKFTIKVEGADCLRCAIPRAKSASGG